MSVAELPVLVVAVPFSGALLTLLARQRSWTDAFGLLAALATAVTAGINALAVHRDGARTVDLGGWAPPLGIELRVDGLAALVLLTTAAVGLATSASARSWFAPPDPDAASLDTAFWPLWLLLWGSLNAVFVTSDLFTAYVALELTVLSAVTLTALTGRYEVLRAAFRYLVTALVGSTAYLLGVAYLYAEHGTLDISLLGGAVEAGAVTSAALLLVTAGLAAKTALFPLHFWLPAAHAGAPAPVSAVLSGVVVKASFVLLLRCWFEVFPADTTRAASVLLGVLGVAAIGWGGARALAQRRLKLLVAQSTVSQLGYLFLVFPIALGAARSGAEVRSMAVAGVAWFVLAHALAKASLFLAVGAIHRRLGHDRRADTAGTATALPVVAVAVLLAGVSLLGLPPSAGYQAKDLLAGAGDAAGQWWWRRVLDAGGVLTAAYLARMVVPALRRPAPGEAGGTTERVPWPLQVAPLALAAAAIGAGLWPDALRTMIDEGGLP
jgi:multicomponent Na+:H+ antiporter subunit D